MKKAELSVTQIILIVLAILLILWGIAYALDSGEKMHAILGGIF
jgi:hypothetical protein